jgi:hypothetical protein
MRISFNFDKKQISNSPLFREKNRKLFSFDLFLYNINVVIGTGIVSFGFGYSCSIIL